MMVPKGNSFLFFRKGLDNMDKPKGLFIADAWRVIYDDQTIAKIKENVYIYDKPYTKKEILDNLQVLQDCEIIFSGWGVPVMDETFLRHAPNLKIVFYGAGSVKCFVTDALWERGIRVCSAWGANALPVAEYTLAHILLGLKRCLPVSRNFTQSRGQKRYDIIPAGGYNSTVGIVSTGMIGRRVIQLLKNFSVHILAYDPYLTPQQAAELGVKKVSLAELFAQSDVVSIHTPALEETRKMITGQLIASMKPGATLINSARGSVIDEAAMIQVLQQRPDLQAVLDVTDPEPPLPDSPLWTMPNVMLTPHIAGSIGPECARHGVYMYEECCRYLAGEPLQWEIDRERVKTMA